MKEVLITRDWKKESYTIGNVYLDGERFANTMEDRDRGLNQDMSLEEIERLKVYGETAIPAGTHEVELTYSRKFKRMLPLIKNVPGFSGIRIHALNTAKDSLGCIGFGDNDKKGWISRSRAYEKKFIEWLREAGGKCRLTIR